MADEKKTTGQYHCGVCGARFNTKQELEGHNKTHMREKEGQTVGTQQGIKINPR